jgi:uncharacterized membrane protein
MPIAKKPIQDEETSESQINAVISKGGSVASTAQSAGNQKILIRIPTNLLDRVDTDLTTRPLKTPRNTWILEAILEKLEQTGNRK